MSFSFIEIEEQKSRFIFALFLFLVFFYFFVAWLLIIPFKIIFIGEFYPNLKESLVALIIAALAGMVHWQVSINNVVERTLGSIGAQPLDQKDVFHHKLKNIIEEASIAAGGLKIECWVIPVNAMNAFALSDFNGRNVIGVTEGLLAKLNRAQLEAVVAHELGHLASGDSTMTTITSSLFGVYSVMMDGIRKLFDSKNNARLGRSRGGGTVIIFLALVYIILAATKLMSTLLNLFISRQREYRADAAAVRLTRDPLSLTEALHLISQRWRGAYLNSEYFPNIFIVSPAYNNLDESEGLFSELFSTHPPVKKRIEIVLQMAHNDLKVMVNNLKEKDLASKDRIVSAIVDIEENQELWMAVDTQGQWQGPFSLEQLSALPWLTAETWVHKENDEKIYFAWQNDDIRNSLELKKIKKNVKLCPKCKVTLSEALYEGVPLFCCKACGGNLVERSKIVRILTRKQQGFSPEVVKMAEVMKKAKSEQWFYKDAYERGHGSEGFACPGCNGPMKRKFYNFDYSVEIDLCFSCDIIWFDKDELEILQFLFEEQEKF